VNPGVEAGSGLIVPAPLWRRLAAAAYDALLLAAVWMVTAVLELVVRAALGLPYDAHVLRALLLLTSLGFFGWFWTHGGQTLGMRAWRLQVRRTDGRPLAWPTALARYAFAWLAWLPLGAGVLWCAIDPRRRAWHDALSATEVVLLPKKNQV
jgi:uncharacterized RDD family membrane protein YckC